MARKRELPQAWQVKKLSWGGFAWQSKHSYDDDVYKRDFQHLPDLEYYLEDHYGKAFAKKVVTAAHRSKGEFVGTVKRNPAKKSKGKTALKTTGKALKGFAQGTLSAASQILGAGASALNPVRRKVKNKYIDLVIKGQAKKTPQGWRVGKKTFEQGRGTVNVSSGYYLDRATGTVYAKRERNAMRKGMRKLYGQAKALQRHDPKRKPMLRKAARRGKQIERRVKRNPSAESIRKKFAGRVTGERDVFVPASTPKGKLAKLGNLVLIQTEQGTIKPVRGSAVLLADTRGKLHIGTTSKADLFNGPRQSFGQVKRIEYDSSKPHLGYPSPIIWHHKLGEESGHRPTLHADGQGGLVFRGGRYRLTRRGIEN